MPLPDSGRNEKLPLPDPDPAELPLPPPAPGFPFELEAAPPPALLPPSFPAAVPTPKPPQPPAEPAPTPVPEGIAVDPPSSDSRPDPSNPPPPEEALTDAAALPDFSPAPLGFAGFDKDDNGCKPAAGEPCRGPPGATADDDGGGAGRRDAALAASFRCFFLLSSNRACGLAAAVPSNGAAAPAKAAALETINPAVDTDIAAEYEPTSRSGAAAAIISARDIFSRLFGPRSACLEAAAALAAFIAASTAAVASAAAAASVIHDASRTRFIVCGAPATRPSESLSTFAFRFFSAIGALPLMSKTAPHAPQTDAGVDLLSFSAKAASLIK